MQTKSVQMYATTELVRHHDIIEYTAKTKQNTPTQCKHTQLRDEVWLDCRFFFKNQHGYVILILYNSSINNKLI